MKQLLFSGCATAMITPFTEDGKDVDYKAFEELTRFQLNNGIDALVVSGTTGESPVLSAKEKSELFRIACDYSKTTAIPVIAGTGSNNTEEAVRKSNEAEKQGVNGLLIVTPYYNKCSQEGLIRHYFYIADRVSAPIIVYNVPSRTGMTIKAETYKALAEHKNIVAVKEASADLSEFIKYSSDINCNLTFYSGNDDLTVPMMSLGAKGVISVVSNIIPQIMSQITHLCNENNFSQALTLNNKYSILMREMFTDINPVCIKSACSIIFNAHDTVRLPLVKFPEDKKQKLKILLDELELTQLVSIKS